MRSLIRYLLTLLIFLSACSDSSTKEQSGVTSTGNAGDVAGYVVVQSGVGLSKQSAANSFGPVDSALVVIETEDGTVVDSMRSNLEGAFRFRKVPSGEYKLWAELDGQRTDLILSLEEQEEHVSRLALNEESVRLYDTVPVGLFSAEPGRVWLSVLGRYAYDATLGQIHFVRTFDGDSVDGGVWHMAFYDPEMYVWNPNQSSCNNKASFFSMAPQQLVGNHWFYNGDLAEDFGGEVSFCSQALLGLSEMNQLGVSGLEMQFGQKGAFKGIFYDGDWCLSEAVSLPEIYQSKLPLNAQMEIRDCNSFVVVQGENDSTTVRVLWLDMTAEWGEEEIRKGDSSWVHRGPWREFSLERAP